MALTLTPSPIILAAMLPLLPSIGHAPDGLFMLFLALALDACLGEMPWLFGRLPHPVVVMGRAVAVLEDRLNRPERLAEDRRTRGLMVAVIVPLSAALIGLAVTLAARFVPLLWVLEVVLAAALIAQRSLFDHVHDVARALQVDGLEAGRFAVSRIVGRDPNSLDRHGVARAAIESLAENFSDAVVAPVFWFVLLGLPGLMAYKAINTLDSMIGHKNERYRAFGWASARLDDWANLIPARIAGVIIALAAAFAPRGRPVKALTTMARDAGHHRSPNSGWPEAAMAGALDLALGGPRVYPGLVVEEQWMGRGRAMAEVADIDRALVVFVAAATINAGWVALLLWLKAW